MLPSKLEMLPVSAGKDLAGCFLGSVCTNTARQDTWAVAGRSDLALLVCQVWSWKRLPWSKWMCFKVWLLVFRDWVGNNDFKGWTQSPFGTGKERWFPQVANWWWFLLFCGLSGKSFRRAAAAACCYEECQTLITCLPSVGSPHSCQSLPNFFGIGEFLQGFAAPGSLCMVD